MVHHFTDSTKRHKAQTSTDKYPLAEIVHPTRDLYQSTHECRNFFTYSLFATDGGEELNKKTQTPLMFMGHPHICASAHAVLT